MKLQTAVLLSFTLCFLSCKDNSQDPQGKYSVSGTVVSRNIPVAKATVSLNNRGDLSTESDAAGRFTLTSVPEGNYSLNIKKANTDGSFIEKTSNISVTGETILQSLILPRGVVLLQPTNITGTSMRIAWNATDANDFREYKLFRHLTSGLDESTGTLIHVATAINDTAFDESNLQPLTRYYYRIYIMNDYGRLGGSNIVSSATTNLNYVVNGDFENNTGLQNWWNFGTVPWGAKQITDSTRKNGSYSLQLAAEPFSEYGISGVRASIHSGYMTLREGDYKVSFWVKVEGIPTSVSTYNWYSFTGSDNYVAGLGNDNMLPIGVRIGSVNANEWTYVEQRVRLLDFYYARYGFYFELRSYCRQAWFDDVKVEKAD
jgi:hypothetical protein